ARFAERSVTICPQCAGRAQPKRDVAGVRPSRVWGQSMADSNLQRRDSSHAFDHDPFAELTRIMGADPRGGDTQRTDDPFDIDLERELLGGFEDEAGASETGSADELEDPPLADLDAQSEQGADEYLRSAPEEPDTAFDAAGEADFDS